MEDALRTSLAWLAAICLTVYWGAVVVKLVRLGRKLRKDPNALPRERVGQLMRVVWYPVILVVLVALWAVATGAAEAWARQVPGLHAWLVPALAPTPGWLAAALPAAGVAIAGTAYTFVCWRRMGRSWRIGIDPKETLELVRSGPYRFVRHPIYATRMAIDLAVLVMVPALLLLVALGTDILLLQIEARREEAYMERTHGSAYASYRRQGTRTPYDGCSAQPRRPRERCPAVDSPQRIPATHAPLDDVGALQRRPDRGGIGAAGPAALAGRRTMRRDADGPRSAGGRSRRRARALHRRDAGADRRPRG
jgi:protein-S-isoprenylcysteine O-methyltransferase Ste14